MLRRPRGGPRGTARVLAGMSALFWAVLFFGLVDLAVPIDQTPGFYPAYLLETGWGVLYTFLVAGAFAVLVWRPASVVPLAQVAVVAVCLALTAVAAGSLVQLAPAVALLVSGAAVAALAGHRPRRPLPLGLDPAVALVAAAVVPPAVAFAIDMVRGFREGRPPLDDVTWGIDHWPTQGAMALTIALVAVVVAAGVHGRWSGVAPSAACAALAAGWFGYWSAVYPDHAGSAGRVWGVAAMVWAVILVGVVVWRLRVRVPIEPSAR